MLGNNLDSENALISEQLIVYSGAGRAVRNWKEFNKIVKALINLELEETLLVQSGKPVGIIRTYRNSPKVLIRNSNIVPTWSTQ